jgi:protein-tyrosine phosphatase
VSDIDLDRLVTFESVHNFRDLGGYPTTDGRRTRWGRLFRADGLQRLTAADLEVLRPLGLRTVIDLRTVRELEERGSFPLDLHPADFHHLPVIDVTWARDEAHQGRNPVEFLASQYGAMLAEGEPRLADAFRVLATPDALPAVFHCAAGKDRTGLLAALVLSALGVPDELVAEDYGLSRAAMERTLAWADRQAAEVRARWEQVPSIHLAAEPEAMRRVLAELHARHGSVRAYVRSIGVGDAVLERLDDALLEDAEA